MLQLKELVALVVAVVVECQPVRLTPELGSLTGSASTYATGSRTKAWQRGKKSICLAGKIQEGQLRTGKVSCLAGLFVAHCKNHIAVDMLEVLLVSKMEVL